jgi:hypothetical protein
MQYGIADELEVLQRRSASLSTQTLGPNPNAYQALLENLNDGISIGWF